MKAILSGVILYFVLFLVGCATTVSTSTVPIYAYPSDYPQPTVVDSYYDGYGHVQSGYWQYHRSCCTTFPGSCCSGGCATASCQSYTCNGNCSGGGCGTGCGLGCHNKCSSCNGCVRPVSLYDDTD